jgi:hypothetical protein
MDARNRRHATDLYEELLSGFAGIRNLGPAHQGFDGPQGSSGTTVLNDVYLTLRGGSDAEHDVTHLHELHHKALNENSAWGAALWFAGAHPAWRGDEFIRLLDACRAIHECFATFMSVSLAGAAHHDALATLDERPLYQHAYSRMKAIVQGVGGNHKQDLAATAVALLCMQSPVLRLMADATGGQFSLSDVPWIDRPDVRLAVIQDLAGSMAQGLGRRADRTVQGAFGVDIQELDLTGATDQVLDSIWEAWSAVIFDGLADPLRDRGAVVLPPHTHLGDARALLAAFEERGISTGFRVHDADHVVLSDLDESIASISRTRYPLRETPWLADLRVAEADGDIPGLLGLVAALASARGSDEPELVLHAREPGRLGNCYSWPQDAFERLRALGTEPCVALRIVISGPDRDEDGQHVLHTVLNDAAQAIQVIETWAERGPTALCVSSRCFVDRSFSDKWLNALRTRIPVIVLLDTSISALIADKALSPLLPSGVPTWVARFGIESTTFFGVLWHSEDQPFIGMYLADSLGTQLVENQIRDGVGLHWVHDDADWSQWHTTIKTVARDLLATESFFDLRAGEEWVTLV